jgi:hypothetical protein
MVLISIHPFVFRKILLVIVALLCFSALCLADPVLMVRRYASHTERLAIPRALVSGWQEPGGDVGAGTVDPAFVNFASTGLPARQLGSALNDGSSTGFRATMPSSVFRNAACAMRSSGARLTLNDGANLPEPTNAVAF